MARLTAANIERIVELLKIGWKHKDIAAEVGCRQSRISYYAMKNDLMRGVLPRPRTDKTKKPEYGGPKITVNGWDFAISGRHVPCFESDRVVIDRDKGFDTQFYCLTHLETFDLPAVEALGEKPRDVMLPVYVAETGVYLHVPTFCEECGVKINPACYKPARKRCDWCHEHIVSHGGQYATAASVLQCSA